MVLVKKIKPLLLGCVIFATSAFAQEASNNNHVGVGSRKTSVNDEQKFTEKRNEEALILSYQELSKDDVEVKAFANFYRPNYSRYSWHWANHVSYDGQEAILEDGSHWEINSWGKNTISSWNYEDALLIMQNDAWCSSYDYILYNKTRGTSVTCNLTISPIIGGQYTHYIRMIDYEIGEIMLEDGTRWILQKDDEYYSKDWLINDLVIIGVNKYDWDSFANILINVNMNNYTRASQL